MNKRVRIYHNPKCSKSREALEYLQAKGCEPEVVDYIADPPGVEELRWLTKLLGVSPSSLIRPADFERLGLTPSRDVETLLAMIAEHPVILHRPIVVVDQRACIARPPQLVDELLGD